MNESYQGPEQQGSMEKTEKTETPNLEHVYTPEETQQLSTQMETFGDGIAQMVAETQFWLDEEQKKAKPDPKKIEELKTQLAELQEQLSLLDDTVDNIETGNIEKISSPITDFNQLYPEAHNENFQGRRNNLNQQYDHPETIKVKDNETQTETGETIEVVDIKPDNQTDKVPMVYFKGFASGNKAYRELMISLGMCGNRVIAMDNPHGIDSARITEDEKKWASKEMGELNDVELRKTAMSLEMMEQKGLEKTDIVAHSEGAIYAVIFALMHPEKVRNLILVEPAGMIGNDKTLELVKRSLDDVKLQGENIGKMKEGQDPYQEHHPDREPDSARIKETAAKASANSGTGMKTWIKSWFSGPKKNVEAIQAIANSDITGALQFLREELGIKVGIIHGVDDQIFPMDKLRNNLTSKMVDASVSIRSSHTSFAQDPDTFAPMIDAMRKGLERKRIKTEENRPLDGFL